MNLQQQHQLQKKKKNNSPNAFNKRIHSIKTLHIIPKSEYFLQSFKGNICYFIILIGKEKKKNWEDVLVGEIGFLVVVEELDNLLG